jgi:hypothetical protein
MMGLDMYLSKEIYIGANYEHCKVKSSIKITRGGEPIKINKDKITVIHEEAGYWRKANQIHKWFVDNIQDGVDNCAKYPVSYNSLLELKELCEKILKTKDSSLLPPTSGFFFGSTGVDGYYYDDLKNTIAIIDNLDPDSKYCYQSSW